MISGGSAHMSNMCLMGSSAFDIYVSRNGTDRFAGVFDLPLTGYTDGYDDIIGQPWLPKGRKGNHDQLSALLRCDRTLDRS